MPSNNNYHNGHIPSNNGQENESHFSFQAEKSESRDRIDLKQFLYVLWNRKWLIAASVLVFGIIATIMAFNATPIYQSEGTMLIEDSQGSNPFGGEGGMGQLLSSSYGLGAGSTLENELQVLKSRKLSLAVADTLMKERLMANGRQFPVLFSSYPEDSTMTSQDTVATRIRKKLTFSKVNREADVIDITYESPSPYEAKTVVNMAMSVYKGLSMKQNRISANSAVTFLETEISQIASDLQDSEQELRAFMNESKLVQVQPQVERLIEQIASLEARRQESRAILVAANSAIEQYRNRLNNIRPGIAEKYSQAIGPKMNRFQYQLAELVVEKEQLLANYPDLENSATPPSELVRLNREIVAYENNIKELTDNLINESDQFLGFLGGSEGGIVQNIAELKQKLIELEVQKQQAQSQIAVISEQLNVQQQFFNNLPDNIIDLAQLKRDVMINEKLYVAVSQQYAETALWQQTQFGLGRIIDSGYLPQVPVSPNKPLYLLIGLILGGILSSGYIIVRDELDTSINGVEKMKMFDEPLLSVIPSMNDHISEHHNGAESVEIQGRNISTGLITVLDSISPISESFRRLQNNLIYSNPDSKMRSIMFTSSAKGEGKTTTISNLAVVLAEAGYETLIVDTDFRRPNLHKMFGTNKKPGFMEVLFDDVKIEEAIEKTISPGLSILSVGRKPPNASVITQSRAFLELIKQLESQYDFLLIDTPPFGIITDASAMLSKADGVVVITKFGETTEVQLSQTLEQLHRMNANITGTVLTSFDHTKSNDYHLSSSYYKEVYQDYNAYQEEA